jgi:hypothetical protein
MKKPASSLIGGLIFLLAASWPLTSDAGSVYGTWQGILTSTSVLDGVEETPITAPFTLTMQWTNSGFGPSVEFNIAPVIPVDFPTPSDPFGAQMVDLAENQVNYGPFGYTLTANFFATYSNITDGNIVGGEATADFTYAGPDPASILNYLAIVDTFQGFVVPEPPTVAIMGQGLLIVVIAARRLGAPAKPSAGRPRLGASVTSRQTTS